jgi:hypothetical protein
VPSLRMLNACGEDEEKMNGVAVFWQLCLYLCGSMFFGCVDVYEQAGAAGEADYQVLVGGIIEHPAHPKLRKNGAVRRLNRRHSKRRHRPAERTVRTAVSAARSVMTRDGDSSHYHPILST